jgi:8-oxo-dGTP pyrophosphatase MutT (NUDIX family)
MSQARAQCSHDDPQLRADSSLESARAAIEAFLPRDERQARFRREMLSFLQAHPEDAHKRSCLLGHLTASALVLDHKRERALLTFHRKLNRWLQLGGHCDGDANLARTALREAVEESGIEALAIDPTPLDVDVHSIPARPGEPEHWHLDTRFLVLAPPGAVATVGEESLDLRWFSPDDLVRIPTDDSVRRLFRHAFGGPEEDAHVRAGTPRARPV